MTGSLLNVIITDYFLTIALVVLYFCYGISACYTEQPSSNYFVGCMNK